MLEFSNLGAGVLHNKCVKIAKGNDIKLMVRSSLNKEVGTTVSRIKEESSFPKITGVTANKDVVSIVGLNINEEIKDKVIECMNRNSLDFKNLEQTDMHISINVNRDDVNSYIRCLHNLFF